MFSDPISLTYNSVATSMPRVSTGDRTATYQSADDALRLTVQNFLGKRERNVVRLDHMKNVVDPFDPARLRAVNMSVYFTLNRPAPFGYTDAEAQLVYDALTGFITNSTNRTKVLGGES